MKPPSSTRSAHASSVAPPSFITNEPPPSHLPSSFDDHYMSIEVDPSLEIHTNPSSAQYANN